MRTSLASPLLDIADNIEDYRLKGSRQSIHFLAKVKPPLTGVYISKVK